jgi:GNAT superfamily N-acetyltransferase
MAGQTKSDSSGRSASATPRAIKGGKVAIFFGIERRPIGALPAQSAATSLPCPVRRRQPVLRGVGHVPMHSGVAMSLPIQMLEAADAGRIEDHLLRLAPADRSLRFAAGLVVDETIRRYVRGIRFGTDAVLGVFDASAELVAFAHGCVYKVGERARVEVAFSVDVEWRGRGLGTALMAQARSFAESIGADSVVGMCLARNGPMRRIFAAASMTMTREDDEVHACCLLAGRAPLPMATAC